MRIEKIREVKGKPTLCFKCKTNKAVNRVCLDLQRYQTVLVCLCDECTAIPEIELMAHFDLRIKKDKKEWK